MYIISYTKKIMAESFKTYSDSPKSVVIDLICKLFLTSRRGEGGNSSAQQRSYPSPPCHAPPAPLQPLQMPCGIVFADGIFPG